MQNENRIVVLPRFRVVLTGAAGPEGPHAHSQAAAAIVLAPPALQYRIAGAASVADPEHVLLVNPLTEIRPVAPPPAPNGGTVMVLLMAPEFVAETLATKRGISPARPFGAVRAPLSAALRGRAERLAGLIRGATGPAAAIAEATTALAQAVLDAHATPAGPGGPAMDFRIRRAIQTIATEPKRVAAVETMLAASELSRSRFFQLFRECTGLTPQMYVDAHAVDAAIDALVRTDRPIARIARELGHGSPERFARYIRRMTGLTPSDLRRAAIRL